MLGGVGVMVGLGRGLLSGLMLFAALFVDAPRVRAGSAPIDAFDSGVAAWSLGEAFGRISSQQFAASAGRDGTGGMQLVYDFGSGPMQGSSTALAGVGVFGFDNFNHLLYTRPVALNLAFHQGISFDFKATGSSVMLFIFLADAQNRISLWGPYGANTDFYTNQPDWYTASLDLSTPCAGGAANLAEIRKVGFVLHGFGQNSGSVTLDNLNALDDFGRIEAAPASFSPNGDAYYDTIGFKVWAPPGAGITLEILDVNQGVAATVVQNYVSGVQPALIRWDGRNGAGVAVADGAYTARATFAGAGSLQGSVGFTVDTSVTYPRVVYQTEPFFPIGLWLEGSPQNAGYTDTAAGAQEYFGRCCADIAAHGFNTITVPNCPPGYYAILLQKAQDHGLKVVLEVIDLVLLVSQQESVSPQTAAAAAQNVFNQVGGWDSLLRYQIRDEPAPSMIANWITVQREMALIDPARPVFSTFLAPESLELLADQSFLAEAVYDIYPHNRGMPAQSMGSFLPALVAFGQAARGYPQWAVLQAFADANFWRYPTAEELRADTYLALSAGAKGIFYFIYQSPGNTADVGGLVGPDFAPRPLFAAATQLAGELDALAPLLLTLRPAGETPAVQGDARAGSFVDALGVKVLIVASHRPDAAITAQVAWDGGTAMRDALTGEMFMAAGGILSVPLAAGAGRVLIGPSGADGEWVRMRD